MQTFIYPSSSGPTPHTVTLHDDGLVSCSCRGYLIKRKDKPRSCRHTEDVIKKGGLHTVQRGDLIYGCVEETAEPLVIETRSADPLGALAQAEADGYVNPMLAEAMTKGQENNLDPFLSGWYWEEKWDGQRVVLAVRDHAVKAWSRPRPGDGPLGLPRALPRHLEEHAKALPDGTYDCEQIVTGGRSWAVSDLTLRDKQALMFFDLPCCVGERIMDSPIEIRRALLNKTLELVRSPYLLMSQTFTPGRAGVEEIWARGGEGAMLKRAGSIYRPGYRGPDWLKVKLWDYTTVTLIGFEERKEGPYAVMLYRFDDGVESKCKTLGHKWLREFEKNGKGYIGQRFVLKHQGRTDDEKKPRHPQFDHFAGEGE